MRGVVLNSTKVRNVIGGPEVVRVVLNNSSRYAVLHGAPRALSGSRL